MCRLTNAEPAPRHRAAPEAGQDQRGSGSPETAPAARPEGERQQSSASTSTRGSASGEVKPAHTQPQSERIGAEQPRNRESRREYAQPPAVPADRPQVRTSREGEREGREGAAAASVQIFRQSHTISNIPSTSSPRRAAPQRSRPHPVRHSGSRSSIRSAVLLLERMQNPEPAQPPKSNEGRQTPAPAALQHPGEPRHFRERRLFTIGYQYLHLHTIF